MYSHTFTHHCINVLFVKVPNKMYYILSVTSVEVTILMVYDNKTSITQTPTIYLTVYISYVKYRSLYLLSCLKVVLAL